LVRRRHVDQRIGVVQPHRIGREQVASLRLGNVFGKAMPGFGINEAHAVQEPVYFEFAAQENAAQNQCRTMLRMGLRIGKRERASP
jgi:hypothetical protein